MSKLIGVQLYSLRQELAQNFAATLQQLAEIGYPILEGYNDMPLAPKAVADMVKTYGMKMLSCHLPLPFDDNEQKVMQAIELYNLQYAIVPSQPREDFTTLDGVKRVCERLNRANEIVRQQGVIFGYHNHEFEFADIAGQSAYNIMLEELDPSIILEIDTYWVQVAGQNPSELVQQLGERSPLLHIKDGAANIEMRDEPQSALGEGNIDIVGVVAAGGDKTDYLIVELDSCATDMMTAIKKSYQYLTQRRLASGNN